MASLPTVKARQRGAALLILFVLLGVGLLALFVDNLGANSIRLERDKITSNALADAKAALIAYALSRGGFTGSARPGEFPCPDTTETGNADGSCTAGKLGRIPWKTLGIPEPKDGDGETLWYAVDKRFRITSSQTINSDTPASMLVYAADGQTALTTPGLEAAAVIFAPGAAIGNQVRQTTSQRKAAANYLESAGSVFIINNAKDNGPFISAPRSATFNDQLTFITTRDFIPVIEKRVASEIKTILAAYYAANGYYPFAAKYDDSTGNCAMNIRRGRIPLAIRVPPPPFSPPNPACGITSPPSGLAEWTGSLPNWFMQNRWDRLMYYSVAPGFQFGGPNSCAGGCLTVDASNATRALFFMPGPPRGAQIRPSNTVGDYLEDGANLDGWGASPDDIYVTPSSASNDQLVQLP